MSIQVRPLESEDWTSWDAFVDTHPHGSPFHLLAWKKSIETTFRYQPHYLLASDAGRIRAVLPLFLVSNLIVGKILLSTPFAVYGGILADSGEALAAMKNH